ncbi:MAG: quinone-dependent dihydroorotate dehydrogenase [Steroidobacteraceae bacterium]
MYSLLRPLLFALAPETAHAITLRLLAALAALGAIGPPGSAVAGGVSVMGLRFPNRLGLAAGFDKNGVAVDGCLRLGFGFVEVGTVTPLGQAGRALPRVFRLRPQQALINRMGFPNAGAAEVAARLQQRRLAGLAGIVGVNIGKNSATPNEAALEDYLACLRTVHAVADYITVNISSPNTEGLRQLQGGDYLGPLLTGILQERDRLDVLAGKRTPVVVKISPDESRESLQAMAAVILRTGIEGVIATNTTLGRAGVESHADATQAGGLSGQPLQARSLQVVRELKMLLGDRVAIIGVGGVDSPSAALALRAAGADLVQLYTALVYQGPGLVQRISRAL